MNKAKFVLIVAFVISVSAPVFSQRVRGEIEESELDREFKKQREAVFTSWMPGSNMADVLRNAELNGKVVLIVERNLNSEHRAIIYTPNNRGSDGEYSTSISESQLLATHKVKKLGGYDLLFLKENASKNGYCAVWIHRGGYAAAVKELAKLGVTPPKILIKESKASSNAGPVTTKIRQWTDKSGRGIEAALVEIDGDKAILAKKGGGKFPYLISNLSVKDQQFLKSLIENQSKPQPEESDNAGKPATFTEWLDRSEWERKYEEEQATGKYAIYIECNNKSELRGIFEKRPPRLGWYVNWLSSEEDLQKLNASYKSKGLTILSLSFERRTKRYNAVWVSNRSWEASKIQLEKLKITPAEIGKKIIVSEVRKK